MLLRIAIVGCGKIADQHVLAIRRIPDCQIVSLCDRELLMAKQLGERFDISNRFSDSAEMLRRTSPHVVHITTPPQSHFPLARQALEFGAHVYLEKPFTVSGEEAESLVRLAESRNLKLTAGHNLQFTNEMLKMRRLVAAGYLGGKAVEVESHFSYGLDDTSYVGPILSSRTHWVRQLPGQLFQNIVSHGIAKLVEFLDDDVTEVIASAHQSDRLRGMGGQEVLDELRVLIRDSSGTTAFFCFSTQVSPGLNQLRICGPKNSLTVDHASGSLIRSTNRSYKSYLTYFLPPLVMAGEHFMNAVSNVGGFVFQRLYQDAGMKELIERFYESIRTDKGPPIPYREIILTAKLMDRIFAQVYPNSDRAAASA